MAAIQFPGASHHFSVLRRTTTTQGFNVVPGPYTSVATGVPINLRPRIEYIQSEQAGIVSSGHYYGATTVAANVLIGDLIQDEGENDANGKPVEYQVEGADNNFAFKELFVYRTGI
jgi:hypothetical protein